MKYERIVRAVAETPWAILPSKLAAILDLIAFRAEGGKLTDEEIRERIGAGPSTRGPLVSSGGTAVIPIYGVIVPKATLMSEMSGGTSLQRFSQAFQQALDDPSVSSILFDVDSPGGMVDLVPEVAEQVRSARGRKPIVAIANTDCYSAAYWLAVQADEFVVTPSGGVGSIGVFTAHDDISKLQDATGVKTTLISAGKYKVEGNPFEPLSDEAREAIQERVNDKYGMFVADVAAGRGVSVEAVREGFGQGRTVTAKKAKQLGMVDRVDTYENTLRRLATPSARSRIGRAEQAQSDIDGLESEPFSQHVTRVTADVQALVSRSNERMDARARAGRTLSKANIEALRELQQQVTALIAHAETEDAAAAPDSAALAAQIEHLVFETRSLGIPI